MTSRHFLAGAALMVIFQLPCSSQELEPALAGRWQYLQTPGTQGEVLDLTFADDRWRGIMNGLERAGEHGLFYYVVELQNLSVTRDGNIHFEVGEREFFNKRPRLSHPGGKGDGGIARSQMRFFGRIADDELVLQCSDEDGSCPDSSLRFKRVTLKLMP